MSSRQSMAFRDVDAVLDSNPDEVVEVARTLMRFRTESVDLLGVSETLPNEEAELQSWMAERLEQSGCEVDSWEPDMADLRGHPLIPEWHHFRDRPLVVGRRSGVGDGRSLILNGHIDVVPVGDPSGWADAPFNASLRDGRLFGRGACDMKGGVAAALVALEAIDAAGVRLRGDLIFQSVTDEEIGGMGTIAAAERGYHADAALMPEPTSLNVCTATRGILHARLALDGRAAHAEVNQPPWREGGGVNANHLLLTAAGALRALGSKRAARDAARHPLLSSPSLEITQLRGGFYISAIPEHAELLVNATYLPGEASERGFGDAVMAEMMDAVRRAIAHDDWLDEHPPRWTWLLDYPANEVDSRADIVVTARAAARAVGVSSNVFGVDSSYDGALLSALYGIPSVAFGPGELDLAHSAKESVGVDELREASRAIARAIIAWCGVQS